MRLLHRYRQNLFTPIKYGFLYNWYAANAPETMTYGYLYNWYAANDVRNIANTGWRLSTHADWQYIATYLAGWSGGQFVANLGGKLKETGTTYWNSPNTDATNIAGFNARGGGRRNHLGSFTTINETANFHTNQTIDPNGPIIWTASNISGNMVWGFTLENFKFGASVRLVKETTTLANGQTGTYIGNDGRVYNTICIGTKEWLSENLWETKYRNGDEIPEVTDNTAWSLLSTGGRCAYNNTPSNVGVGNRITSSDDWIIPTIDQLQILADYSGASGNYTSNTIGGKLKEIGTTHWDTPNTGATNELVFNGRGSGNRNLSGFSQLKNICGLWTTSVWFINTGTSGFLYSSDSLFSCPSNVGQERYYGYSIRLLYTGAGIPTSYTGNDGKVYRVITIGTQTWLADNLAETKYRDSSWISGYDGGVYTPISDGTWSSITTGALCAYNNDLNNV